MSNSSRRSSALRTTSSRSGSTRRSTASSQSSLISSSSAGLGRRGRKDVDVDEDFDVVEIASKPPAKRTRKSKVDVDLADSRHSSTKLSQPSSQRVVSSWVTSSFGSTSATAPANAPKPATTASKLNSTAGKGSGSLLTWCDKHKPKTLDDLAVHRKKIEDVQHWLERTFSTKRGSANWVPPITLLTGPAGCGKSTTVQVLCRSLHADLHEWQNPTISSSWQSSRGGGDSDAMPYESEVQSFREFLLRANKYGSIALKGLAGAGNARRVLMIEELPNALYRQPSLLHSILGDYAKLGCSPLVFVASDSPRSDISTAQLFPERILGQIGINSIHFNPVAQTSLVKCLTRIASAESSKASLDKASIEGLAASSCGDVRSAVNSLQFACRRDTRDLRGQLHAAKANALSHSSSSRGSKSASASLSSRPSATRGQATSAVSTADGVSVGGRDMALFLFRALGKVLYCKRDTGGKDDSSQLPSHLHSQARQPALAQAEDILDHSHLSSEMFSMYLHQNYLSFHTDIDNVAAASDYLSCSALYGSDWNTRSLSSQMTGSIACRSIMFANDGVSCTAPGWKPLHKPQWLSVAKERQQRVSSGQVFLLHDRADKLGAVHSHEAVYTELLPAMGLLNSRFLSPDHIAFIHATVHYPRETRHRSRSGLQTLGELDVDEDGDGELPSSQVLHTSFTTLTTASTTTNTLAASSAATVANASLKAEPPPSQSTGGSNAAVGTEVLDALGDDLLTNEDIDAFLDFDDDCDDCDADLVADDSVDNNGQDKPDLVEDFSDDDNW
ncbi:cell cycle checkpoint protein RAD17-like [Sycon ciliatum]|uniref:cell cycle checkpoint protein RAD17-like n=1 Tax=Sycon ciliatum TaxID=27933 RepID=UPI0031F71C6B